MKKNRIVALAAALAVTASAVLTGCGTAADKEQESSTTKAAGTQNKTESTGTQEQKEELEPVTLTYWMGATESEDTDMVMEAVNEYLAEVLPNTTLEMVFVPLSEWSDRWSKAMASQEKIDVSWFGWFNSMETEVSMGSLMPIDDLVAQYGQGIVEAIEQVTLDNHRALDGNMYFIPAWQGLIGNRYAVYLPQENVDLLEDGWAEAFQAALYENAKTAYWDKDITNKCVNYLEQYLEASKEAGMLGYGLNINNDPVKWMFRTSGQGVTNGPSAIYVTLQGDTIYLEPQSSATYYEYDMIRIYHDWYKKGYIREDVASAGTAETTYSLETRGSNYITKTKEGWTDQEPLRYTTEAGYEIAGFFFKPVCQRATGYQTGTVIPATSENPERAMMLLDLIYTDPELYQMIVYGIEGTHYTKNSDGTITYPENKTYTGPSNWQLGTCINSLQTDVTQLDYYKNIKEAELKAETAAYTFKFDQEPVSVELANIKAIQSEYTFNSLVALDNWEEVLKERSAKLIAAGIETVLKEMYNQLLPQAEEYGLKVEIRNN